MYLHKSVIEEKNFLSPPIDPPRFPPKPQRSHNIPVGRGPTWHLAIRPAGDFALKWPGILVLWFIPDSWTERSKSTWQSLYGAALLLLPEAVTLDPCLPEAEPEARG
jgi:hypothetical protein